MLRQLLTFFALITGLAATAVPAQARMIGVETRVEATFEIVVTADRRQQQAAMAPLPPVVQAVVARSLAPVSAAPAWRGVYVGIDRARE